MKPGGIAVENLASKINKLEPDEFIELLKRIRLVSLKELANFMGLSTKHVRNEVAEDPRLPRIRTRGGNYRFSLGECLMHMKRRSAQPFGAARSKGKKSRENSGKVKK